MKYLVTGTSVRTPPPKAPGAPVRTFARIYIVKPKTMQPGIDGFEAMSCDCDPEVAVAIEKARKPLGAVVAELELDMVTFGDSSRGSFVAGTPLPELAPRFTAAGLDFVPRTAPRPVPTA